MADSTEDVKYSFQGDTSSLRKATQDAIAQLNRFEGAIQKVATQDGFKASRTSVQGLQRAVNSLTTQTNALTKVLNNTSAALDTMMPRGVSEVAAVTAELAESVRYLDGVTGATSADFQLVTSVLKDLGVSMSSVAAQAAALGTALKAADAVQQQSEQSTKTFSDAMNATAKSVEHVVQVMPRIQDAYQLSGKSALESARVFASSESVWRRLLVELTNVGKVSSDVWGKFTTLLKSVQQKIQSFSDKAQSVLGRAKGWFSPVAAALRRTSSESEDASESMAHLASQSTRTAGSLKTLHSVTGFLSKVFVSLTGVRIGNWLADAAKQSIRYTENVNLFAVAMGDAIDKGTEFVATMQELYGMDPSNLMQYVGNFYQLATAIEMPDAAATNLSLVLTKASNDIASLFNVDIETVFENLSSGMQGMSRAVRKYGMDIRTSTLQTEALALGITDQVESMSEANRMGLRFLTIMKQASNANGDFARTIETPANQLRIFKEQMAQLGRAIGNFFIGPLSTAIAYINGFIMALRTVLTFIGDMIGIVTGFSSAFDTSSADDEATAIAGIGDAASGAAKQMKNLIAPFDELNVLQDTSSGSGGGGDGISSGILDPRIAEAIESMDYQFEQIKMKANQVRDAILEFLGFKVDLGKIISWDPAQFETNLINKFPQWTKTIQAVFANWSDIIQGFKNVFGALGEVFDRVKTKVLSFLSVFINDDTVSSFIEGLADSLNTLASWISEHSEGIANFVLLLGSLWLAFRMYTGVSALLKPLLTFISTCAGAIAPFEAIIGTITAIVAAIVLLYQNSEQFAASFNQLVTSVVSGLLPIFEALSNLLGNIWQGIQELWTDHVQPMLTQTGDALAPVLDTISVLWTHVSRIVTNAINLMSDLWSTVLMPVFAAVLDAVGNLMSLVGTLWREILGPVIEHVAAGVSDLWATTLQPIIQKIIEIVGGVIEIILALWNNVLTPILDWLISSLGPSIRNLISTIWDIVSSLFKSIGGVIEGLLTALQGIVDFLAGVFTGDWERAWKGIVNIFIGLGNAIISAFEFCVNAVIGLINGMISLVYDAVVALINSILSAVSTIADLLGLDLDLEITAPPPAIPTQSWDRIPALATGGVVSSPTTALIGEGVYSEAVIPLDDSPQMQDLIQKIADAANKDNPPTPVTVNVYIGDEEFDAYTYKASERGRDKVGAQPIKTGG